MHTTLILGWMALVGLVAVGWRAERRRELAWQRFTEADGAQAGTAIVRSAGLRLLRRWIWVPWALGLIAAVAALAFRFSPPYVLAVGLMVGLLSSQVESFLAAQHSARLESQLADAIDIMIGAVGAGASVGTAIEAAITECRAPLRPYLEEVFGRIRLGDEPAEVFRSLAERVPLETFLLFTSALGVHWEVGGKLSSTLTTVGRTIRDRIDVSRRIRSNTAQSQFSTLAIIGLTYFIAVIVWRNGPEQMEEFVRSSVGSWFVAGSVILQAVGIVWMNVISKPRF
ncbi:MAG TPA: type II secretion system F family protein [Pirellulaceae bacterium]|nr:type II secretion system F family protein [Pirellulaceae bacterium]